MKKVSLMLIVLVLVFLSASSVWATSNQIDDVSIGREIFENAKKYQTQN